MRLRPIPFFIGVLFAAGAMAQTQTAPQAQTANTGETQGSLASGMTINAELKSSMDSKKIKPNDKVTAQTTEKVTSSDGRTILPKGAKLMGHVTQAEARDKGDKESMVAVQFDKAMTKDGQEIPLNNVAIQAIAPPPNPSAYSAAPGGPAATGGGPTGGSGAPANNPSMSGSTGARTGGSTTGSNPPNAYPGAVGQSQGGAASDMGPLPPNSQGVYGLQNLKLARQNSPNGENSVIISNDKHVHLDSGTRLLLSVQPPQGSSETPGR